MSGKKIIESLKEAVAGNFARVTIEGQTWAKVDEIRASALEEAAKVAERPTYGDGSEVAHDNPYFVHGQHIARKIRALAHRKDET